MIYTHQAPEILGGFLRTLYVHAIYT